MRSGSSSSKGTTNDHCHVESDHENKLAHSGSDDKMNENNQTQGQNTMERLHEFAQEAMLETRTTVQGNHEESLDKKLKLMNPDATAPVTTHRPISQFTEAKEEDWATLDNQEECLEKTLQPMMMDGIVASNMPEDSTNMALTMAGNQQETGKQTKAAPGAIAIMGTTSPLMDHSHQYSSVFNVNESTAPESTDTTTLQQMEEQAVHYAAATLVVDEYSSSADPPVLANATKIDTEAIEQAGRRRQVKTALVSFVLALAAAGIAYAIYASTRQKTQPATVTPSSNVINAPNETLTLNPSASPSITLPTSMQPISATPVAQPVTLSPSIQPISAPPVSQPVTTPPSIQPISATPVTQPVTPPPSTQPISVTPVTQPVTTPPSIQPISVTPLTQPVTTPPSIQPFPTSVQPISTTPVAQPVTLSPSIQPISVTPIALPPSMQPISVTPVAQPVTTPPSIQPISVTPVTQPVTQPTSCGEGFYVDKATMTCVEACYSNNTIILDGISINCDVTSITFYSRIIPPSIAGLTDLTYLGASSLTSGSIPTELGKLTTLTQLYFYGNTFSGEVPTEIGQLNRITEITFRYNVIASGMPIPTELGKLIRMTNLIWEMNDFPERGEIPTELGNLSRLTGLDLSATSISGEIPSELGKLTLLKSLSTEENKLKGNIPSEIGSMSSLITLRMSGNDLSGQIPTIIGNLVSLSSLYLENNEFSGSVPSELSQLSDLAYLYLFSNDLAITIPAVICQVVLNTSLNIHADCLICPSPDGSCCSSCI